MNQIKLDFYMLIRLSIVYIVLISSSCIFDNGKITSSDLEGLWQMYDAERNGNKTKTLKGAYFHFRDSFSFESNLLGDTLMSSYILEEKVIVQESPYKLSYEIQQLHGDTMILNTIIDKLEFTFYLEKVLENE